MIKILGIKIIDRIKEAGLTQSVLSRHATVITTRLGFHEVTEAVCSREAYIVLHINGDPADSDKLTSELMALGGNGCNIRTRLGVNEVFFGEPAGLIILELKGDTKQRILLEKDLKALKQVHVRTMVFP